MAIGRHYCCQASLFGLLLSGCSLNSPLVTTAPEQEADGVSIELTATPFYPQTTDQCGPAALATVLNAAGIKVDLASVSSRVYIPDREGSLQLEMLAAIRSYGGLPYPVGPDPVAILKELEAGHPVLVFQNLGTNLFPTWHYAVVVGYLPNENAFVLRSAARRRHLLPTAKFVRTWRRTDSWAVVVLPPGELPADPDPSKFLRASADLESVGQFEASATAFAAATQRWPDNPLAWFGLGNANYQLGHLHIAEQAFSEALRIDGQNIVALNNLALVQADLGRIGESLKTIDSALALASVDEAVFDVIEQTRSDIKARETGTSRAEL